MRWWPVTLFLLGISILSAQQDARQKPGSLTLEDVRAMVEDQCSRGHYHRQSPEKC